MKVTMIYDTDYDCNLEVAGTSRIVLLKMRHLLCFPRSLSPSQVLQLTSQKEVGESDYYHPCRHNF